jgi:hypothetical protein
MTIIEPLTLKIVGSIQTGQPEFHVLRTSADERRGYTASVGPGTVSVLDLVGRTTLAVIPVAGRGQHSSISPDSRWLFASDHGKPRPAAIDTATN